MELSALKTIHQQIKDHPYRLDFNKSLAKDYCKLLGKFSSESVKAFRQFNEEMKTGYKGWGSPHAHDFNRAISNLQYDKTPTARPEEFAFIEMIISQFHDLLEHNTFTKFYYNINTHSTRLYGGVLVTKNTIGVMHYSHIYNHWSIVYDSVDNFNKNRNHWREYFKKQNYDFTNENLEYQFIEDHYIKDGIIEYV